MASFITQTLNNFRKVFEPTVETAQNNFECVTRLTRSLSPKSSDTSIEKEKIEKEFSQTIQAFQLLKSKERSFSIGPSTAPSLDNYESASLVDFVNLIKQFKQQNSSKFFAHRLESSPDDLQAFEAAIECLEAEISVHLETLALTDKNEIQLNARTINAICKLIGTATRLYRSSKSFTDLSCYMEKAHELLIKLSLEMQELCSLLSQETIHEEEVFAKKESAKEILSQVLEEEQEVFLGQTLTRHERLKVQRLLTLFDANTQLQALLRRDSRFKASYQDLLKQTTGVGEILLKHISKQQGLLTTLIKNSFDKVSNYASVQIPFLKKQYPQGEKEPDTPFDILRAAINHYLFIIKTGSKSSTINQLVRSLLSDCEAKCEGFTQAFFLKLADEKLPEDQLIKRAMENKDTFNQAFEAALVECFEVEGAETTTAEDILDNIRTLKANQIQKDQKAQASQHGFLQKYINDVLSLLQTFKEMVPAATLTMMGNTLLTILESTYVKQAIDSQKLDEKEKIESLFKDLIDQLKQAIIEGKTEGYFRVFKLFKKKYTEVQIILDAVALPSTFDYKQPSVENPHISLTQIRKELEIASQKPEQQQDWTLNLENKSKQFISNIIDFATYNAVLGFIGSKEEASSKTEFCKIIQASTIHTSEEGRKKAFLIELRRLIAKSDAGFAMKKALKITLPYIYKIISFYVSQGAKEGLNYLNTVVEDLENEDGTTRLAIFSQFSHATSMYAKMLSDWSEKKGDKQVVVEQMLREPLYNNGVSQKELYDAVAKKAVYKFVKGSRITDRYQGCVSWIKDWVNAPTFEETSAMHALLNLVLYGVKALIGVITAALITMAHGIGYVGEKFINSLVKKAIVSAITRKNQIDNLVMLSRESIYDSNPYVNTITEFLVEQLETLSKTLDGVVEKDPQAPKIQIQISPVVRERLSAAVKNYLYALKLDSFDTSEEAKQYLTERGYSQILSDKISDSLLPSVTDSVINVYEIGSKSLLRKQSLNESLCHLLDQLNVSLTTHTGEKTQAEKERARRKHSETEIKLDRHIDLILKQLVSISVENTIDNHGNKLIRESEEFRLWIQKSVLGNETESGLSQRISQTFQLYEIENSLEDKERNDALNAITALKEELNTFCEELDQRLLKFEDDSNDRAIKDFHSQLLPLKEALKQTITEGSFLSTLRNLQTLDASKKDLPHLEYLKNRFSQMRGFLSEEIQPDGNDYTKGISGNLKIIHRKLFELNTEDPDNRNPLKLQRNNYLNLKSQVLFSSPYQKKWTRLVDEFLEKNQIVKDLEKITAQPLLENICDLRKSMINEGQQTRSNIFSRTNKEKRLDNMVKTFLRNFEHPQLIALSSHLTPLCYEIATHPLLSNHIDNHLEQIQEAIQTTIETLKAESTTLVEEILEHQKIAEDLLLESIELLKKEIETLIPKIKSSQQKTLETVGTLSEAANNLEPIKFVRVNVGIIDRIKVVAKKTSLRRA